MSQCDGDPISSLTDSLSYSGGEIFVFIQDGVTRQGTINSFVPYLSSRLVTQADLDAISIPWDDTYNEVIVDGGQSRWSSNYSLTNILSSWWTGAYDTVEENKAQWNTDVDVKEEFKALSGKWESSSTTVQNNSSAWAEIFDSTLLAYVSSNWDNTYDTVRTLSAVWNNSIQDQINIIVGLSADWQEAYTTVSSSSANWNEVVDSVSCKSWDDEFITIGVSNVDLDMQVGDSVDLRSPYTIGLTEVRASVGQAPIGGDIEIDILDSGLSILNSPLVIDASQTTSTTSTRPYELNTRANIIDNTNITINVQSVGGVAQPGKGLKVTLIGNREGCVDNPPPSAAVRVVTQQLTAPTTFIAGDIIQFITRVTNTGGDTVTGVLFTNNLSINITEDSSGLAAGNKTIVSDGSAEVRFSYTVTPSDVEAWLSSSTPILCRSTISSNLGNNIGVVQVSKFTRDNILDIIKTLDIIGSGTGAGCNGFIAGDRVFYDVTVTNNNAVEVTGAQLFDSLAVTVVNDTSNITQTAITILPGSTINVRYYYTVSQSDVDSYETGNIPILNTASVQHTRAESNGNTVAFDNLELSVVIPTSDVVYYESVSNNGTIFTLAGTDIADGFTYSFNNIPPITTTFVSQTELPFYTLPLITLLDITEPGNNNDGNYGGVQYKYEISKYAISTAQIDKYNADPTNASHQITYDIWAVPPGTGCYKLGNDFPATNISWYDAARFTNWLNTREGYREAYRFVADDFELWPSRVAWQAGGENLFRHKDCRYFIPSEDEWYKAAYYDVNKTGYWLYPTGSDTPPSAVSNGTAPNTAVYSPPGPQYRIAYVNSAGGASPFGTVGQGGNTWEWLETTNSGSFDVTENRVRRGGDWASPVANLQSTVRESTPPEVSQDGHLGFRVASNITTSKPLLELITIGDAYNSPNLSRVGDEGGRPLGEFGYVPYVYQIAKYTTTKAQIEQFNRENPDGFVIGNDTGDDPEMPARKLSWNEAARYVNWLNTREGYQEAYKFSGNGINDNIDAWSFSDAWRPELVDGRWYKTYARTATNYFRHADAKYFICSEDEWYKAAYYDAGQEQYYLYGTGSILTRDPVGDCDDAPLPVSSGTDANTQVWQQSGPADVRFAGGVSTYGVMGMGGNGYNYMETAESFANTADTVNEQRARRGGGYNAAGCVSISNVDRDLTNTTSRSGHTLRITANPNAKKKVYNTDARFTDATTIPDNSGSTRSVWMWPAFNATSAPAGNLTHLSLNGDVSVLDVSGNLPLVDLNCEGNQIETLNVTSNVALTGLNCKDNNITALDVSNNTELKRLICSNNDITPNLDVSANTKLVELDVSETRINSLDLDSNTNIEKLACGYNDLIDNLDVHPLTSLKVLDCADLSINSLVLSACTELTDLSCDNNTELGTLDVTDNLKLVYCSCPRLNLGSIDLSNNIELEYLHISEQNSSFNTIDLTNNTKLNFLNLAYNYNINTLNVTNNINLYYLNCASLGLSDIDIDNLGVLHTLYINNCQLTSLDIDNNIYLYRLGCHNNSISTLNFTNNTELAYITCSNNELTTLDVQNQSDLKLLHCDGNLLTSLSVANKDKLEKLLCDDNNLTNLNISGCLNMKEIDCSGNNISTITATNWAGSNVLCNWSNNQLTTDDLWSTLDQADSCDPSLPTVINIVNNPAVVNGVLQDGLIHTSSELISKALGKNYALLLS